MGFRTSAFSESLCSPVVLRLLVVFPDEFRVAVAVDSRVFLMFSAHCFSSLVTRFPSLSFIGFVCVDLFPVTWLFDIVLSGLSYQQPVLLQLPKCRRSVFCLCAYSSLLCPVFCTLYSVPRFVVYPCTALYWFSASPASYPCSISFHVSLEIHSLFSFSS
ncbi:unnamed protein product [Heterobilharzia americana]|nr:unnamed protein product [Heterobilharzia americana]